MQSKDQPEVHKHADRPIVGITLGDTNGIGPEVVLKALQDPRLQSMCIPVIYGSLRLLKRYKKALGDNEETNYHLIQSLDQINSKKINLLAAWDDDPEVILGTPTQASGWAAYMGLERAVADAKAGLLLALITAPIAKHNMPKEFAATGHTDYLARELGGGKSLMIMAADTLKVALATDHIALQDVAKSLTPALVKEKINQFAASLRTDFNALQPKIAVLGLNPHAGEDGRMGKEEQTVLRPVMQELAGQYPMLVGPFAADGFFGQGAYKKFDGILALYHDQGLIPFKTLAAEEGVNFTAGLPIVRTSPAHGTAFDIAGKNIASESSTRAAIWCAIDVAKRRLNKVQPYPRPDKTPKPL